MAKYTNYILRIYQNIQCINNIYAKIYELYTAYIPKYSKYIL